MTCTCRTVDFALGMMSDHTQFNTILVPNSYASCHSFFPDPHFPLDSMVGQQMFALKKKKQKKIFCCRIAHGNFPPFLFSFSLLSLRLLLGLRDPLDLLLLAATKNQQK